MKLNLRKNKKIFEIIHIFLNMMIKTKQKLNVTYDEIANNLFKLKESEKYILTDKLKRLGVEKRKSEVLLQQLKASHDARAYTNEDYIKDLDLAEQIGINDDYNIEKINLINKNNNDEDMNNIDEEYDDIILDTYDDYREDSDGNNNYD